MSTKDNQFVAGFYGIENQLIQTAEEAAELSQAAIKRYRSLKSGNAGESKKARQHLLEELADVLNMIQQISYIEGFEDSAIGAIMEEKTLRQIRRIRGEADDDVG